MEIIFVAGLLLIKGAKLLLSRRKLGREHARRFAAHATAGGQAKNFEPIPLAEAVAKLPSVFFLLTFMKISLPNFACENASGTVAPLVMSPSNTWSAPL